MKISWILVDHPVVVVLFGVSCLPMKNCRNCQKSSGDKLPKQTVGLGPGCGHCPDQHLKPGVRDCHGPISFRCRCLDVRQRSNHSHPACHASDSCGASGEDRAIYSGAAVLGPFDLWDFEGAQHWWTLQMVPVWSVSIGSPLMCALWLLHELLELLGIYII